MAITIVAQGGQFHQFRLTEHVVPSSPQYQDILRQASACETSHPRVRHPGTDLKLLLGGVLEELLRREHNRGRAHALMRRIDPWRALAFLNERLRGPHQTMAR